MAFAITAVQFDLVSFVHFDRPSTLMMTRGNEKEGSRVSLDIATLIAVLFSSLIELAMMLLVQILLHSYFCHRSNFTASGSDLIAVLFSSLTEL